MAYGRKLPLTSAVIFGGVNQHTQVKALRAGVDILIATPGRLLDLFNQRHVRLGGSRRLSVGRLLSALRATARLPRAKANISRQARASHHLAHRLPRGTGESLRARHGRACRHRSVVAFPAHRTTSWDRQYDGFGPFSSGMIWMWGPLSSDFATHPCWLGPTWCPSRLGVGPLFMTRYRHPKGAHCPITGTRQ
jgi:hypothetical protein